MKFRLTIISFLILSGLSVGSLAYGATCNDQADGNWNSSATWSCGVVPDGDDDVTIDSHTVTMTADSSSNTVTISGGTLNMGSYTHTNDYGWTYTSGTVDAGTSTLKFNSTNYNITFTPGDVQYYNLEFANTSNGDMVLSSDLQVINELRLTNGDFINNTGNYKITTKNFIQSAGTVNLGSGTLKVTGNFTRTGGTFTAGTSVVSFQGKNQVINVTGASTTFYKLYKLVNSADTLTITAGNTITIASGGVMRFWGKPEGKTLSIVSSSPGTPYTITRTGTAELEYTNWSDASWSASQTASASTLGTGNTNLSVTKEFISTIRATGGDYTTLSAWESAVNCDLTVATTKVFSHSGITGAMPDNSTVTGLTSGVTGTMAHTTATQILIKSITGTFQSGEQVQIDGSNYVTISDDGYGAIATAHPYNDWPSGLDDYVTIDGWTTGSNNFVNVYVPISERHNGKAKDENGNYTGFAMKKVGNENIIFKVKNDYSKVSGLMVDGSSLIYSICFYNSANYIQYKNCIAYSAKGTIIQYGNGFFSAETREIKMLNFISYNSDSRGFSFSAPVATYNIYNCLSKDNASHGFYFGMSYPNQAIYSKNSLSMDNGVTYFDFKKGGVLGILGINFSASSDATADDWGGTGNRINQTFAFVDETNDDFHLAENDTGAKGYGTDLSIDPDFPVIDDIDGQTRPVWDAWDIGADQTPKKIYRSVGPGNTTAIATGSANSLNIASDWAIFASDLPDNVGVGDAIQYDSNDDGTIDAIAFISERLSSTSYRVQNATGETPVQTTVADNDWSLFRAYTALASAESGTENTGINATVRNFDTWSGGRDLTTDDVQWNIACYGDAEESVGPTDFFVTIDGWEMTKQNYLKIYTPFDESEVGISQRHNGKWDDSAYRIVKTNMVGYGVIMRIYEDFVTVEGLQIKTNQYGIVTYSSNANGEIIMDNLIGNNDIWGYIFISSTSGIPVIIKNSVFYNLKHGIIGYSTDTSRVKVYNSTIIKGNSYYPSNTAALRYAYGKNIIGYNFGGGTGGHKDFLELNSSSSNLVCKDNSCVSYSGSFQATQSLEAIFKGPNSYDYHLAPNSQLKNAGADLSNDPYLPFNTDIDGESRQGTWDIGADEILGQILRTSGKIRLKGVRLGGE